jgi:hypothetical protein
MSRSFNLSTTLTLTKHLHSILVEFSNVKRGGEWLLSNKGEIVQVARIINSQMNRKGQTNLHASDPTLPNSIRVCHTSDLSTSVVFSLSKWLLTDRVDLDLAHRQTLARSQNDPQISPERNTVKARSVWGRFLLGRCGGVALRVASCVVRRAAAAHPDLEAPKARCAS